VLDDVNDSMLFHDLREAVKRDVVRDALTKAIVEDSARLVSDLNKLRKGDLLGRPHLKAVKKDGA